MQQLLSQLGNTVSIPARDLLDILVSLVLSIVIALVVAQLYKITHRGLNYELSFMRTLVLLAPIVTSVMLFIRGDLVLSLGLIGSLSIIRFRTPIKDTRDMVFIFWVISVGLGCGTYNWVVVILTTLIVGLLLLLLHRTRYGTVQNHDFVLVLCGQGDLPEAEIHTILHTYVKEASIRSQEIDGDAWEMVYELQLVGGKNSSQGMIRALTALPPVRKASLLTPQIVLPA